MSNVPESLLECPLPRVIKYTFARTRCVVQLVGLVALRFSTGFQYVSSKKRKEFKVYRPDRYGGPIYVINP